MESVYKSLEDFVAKQFQLIEKERDAEVEETRALRDGLAPKVPLIHDVSCDFLR